MSESSPSALDHEPGVVQSCVTWRRNPSSSSRDGCFPRARYINFIVDFMVSSYQTCRGFFEAAQKNNGVPVRRRKLNFERREGCERPKKLMRAFVSIDGSLCSWKIIIGVV